MYISFMVRVGKKIVLSKKIDGKILFQFNVEKLSSKICFSQLAKLAKTTASVIVIYIILTIILLIQII